MRVGRTDLNSNLTLIHETDANLIYDAPMPLFSFRTIVCYRLHEIHTVIRVDSVQAYYSFKSETRSEEKENRDLPAN